MFIKPFRVKSTSQVKSSDRKRLRSDISERFPNLKKEEIEKLVPAKTEMTIAKIATHAGIHVFIYYNQKAPIFFSVDKVMYPTVYTLWMYPSVLHKFYTWPNVLDKFCGGADLMLPGVVLNLEDYGPQSFGNLDKDEMCSICLVGNDAPIAIGKTAMSSQDMFDCGKRGKGVVILHVYTDQLWQCGDMSEPPDIPSSMVVLNDSDETMKLDLTDETCDTEILKEGVMKIKISSSEAINETNVTEDNESSNHIIEEEEKIEGIEQMVSPIEEMDKLLYNSFLCALKISGKKLEFPVLTSTFYRSHMVQCCPAGSSLDIKKSSYKKLSKFLNEMKNLNIISLQELTKGVESITNVDLEHPEVKYFKVVKADLESKETVRDKDKAAYEPPEIVELFCINAQVLPIFQHFGYRKGEFLNASDVRKAVTDYVKENELQDVDNGRFVKLDAHITDSLLSRNEYNSVSTLPWEDIHSRMFAKMQPGFQLTFRGQKPVVKKGKLEPIDVSVVQRSGNKKVTLVHNLVTYGIDPTELAHKIQIGVAASTSVNPSPPNRKDGPQVLIQGNQVKYVGNILTGEYKLHRKLIKGLELASKKKQR